MKHVDKFLKCVSSIAEQIDPKVVAQLVEELVLIRKNYGRVFVLGVGGSAANASHLVNDLRKLCHIEAYCPTDNVSELTARVNDENWEDYFVNWLNISRFNSDDALFILSVGGGDKQRGVSVNLINATNFAHDNNATVLSIVGKADGYVALNSDVACIIPDVDDKLITPLSEAWQGVIWHGIVSHPLLQAQKTTW